MAAATMQRRHRPLLPTTVRRPQPVHRPVGLVCLNDRQLPQCSPYGVGSRHSAHMVLLTPPSSLADRHNRQRPPRPSGRSREQHRQRPRAFVRRKSRQAWHRPSRSWLVQHRQSAHDPAGAQSRILRSHTLHLPRTCSVTTRPQSGHARGERHPEGTGAVGTSRGSMDPSGVEAPTRPGRRGGIDPVGAAAGDLAALTRVAGNGCPAASRDGSSGRATPRRLLRPVASSPAGCG